MCSVMTVECYDKRGICRRRVSVCLSVTLRYCMKLAKHRITQIMPQDSPATLVSDAKDHSKIPTESPPTGMTNASGVC